MYNNKTECKHIYFSPPYSFMGFFYKHDSPGWSAGLPAFNKKDQLNDRNDDDVSQ